MIFSKTIKFIMLPILPAYSDLIEGQWPQPSTSGSGPIPVAIPLSLADEVFLNIGDLFDVEGTSFIVTGIFVPRNSSDPIWFDNAEVGLMDKIWVPDETFQTRIGQTFEKPLFYTSWYIIFSDSSMRFQKAVHYGRGLVRLDN